MVNLTQHFKTTKYLIDHGSIPQQTRPYLGMSGLGHSCPRYLWYTFRWYYKDEITKRLARLFARGHREEPEIIKELQKVGIRCSPYQAELIAGFGHIKGHIDGICINVPEAPKTPHLLEFKTMNDSSFKALKKKMSVEKAKPVYYAQVQLYMYFKKLKRTLWIAANKNDDDLYVERIKLDKGKAEDLIRKGESIVIFEHPPERAFTTKTYYECKWCNARDVCWNDKAPERNCRTCDFISVEHDGKFGCIYHKNDDIPVSFQRTGCDMYTRVT